VSPVACRASAETKRQTLARWTLAALFAMAVHSGVALAVAHWPSPESSADEPPAAMMIELVPLPSAPDAAPQEVEAGLLQQASEEAKPVETKTEPLDDTPTEPEPLAAEMPSETLHATPDGTVSAMLEMPDLPAIKDAEAVLEVQAARPAKEKAPAEPKTRETKKETDEKAKPKKKSVAQQASAPKPSAAARVKSTAAPTSSTGSSMSMATWRGQVMAHLNRRKRHPGGAAGGTASVSFTIDRSGRVLSARLIRSSGSAILDREAVALARRASPVPAPPAGIGRSTVNLSVPVRFAR
jgi:protein TonB